MTPETDYPWTYREYMESVETIAESIWDEIEHDPDSDDRSDRIHESVDGSQWIAYTGRARAVLVHSESIDAIDDAGDEIPSSDAIRAITVIAFYAMRQDVEDALQRLIDDHDPEACAHDACAKRRADAAADDDANP